MRRRLNVTENIIQSIMRRKLGLLGHICKWITAGNKKRVMTEMMEGTGRKGRPCKVWIEDIKNWCQTDVYSAAQIAQDSGAWKNMVKMQLSSAHD